MNYGSKPKTVEKPAVVQEPVYQPREEPAVVQEPVYQPVEEPQPVYEKPDVYVPEYDGRLQVATYNAGLARGYDPTVEARLQATISAAANMPADIVCL